jgi:hypothetical protein
MITDNFRQQLIDDGTEATLEQVNNAQRFLGARLLDQVLGQLIIGQNTGSPAQFDPEFPGQRGIDPPLSPYAYCLTPGGAYLRQGSANNKVQIAPGTLLQRITNPRPPTSSGAGGPGIGGPGMDGLEETLLAFTFDGTTELAIANGDATNPRVDIVQMQLSFVEGDLLAQTYDNATPPAVLLISQGANTTRRVQCALSVKQGTPAAAPAYPDPDAGCVVVAGIVVGATYSAAAGFKFYDTAGAVAVLHDQRVPLCVRGRTVAPRSMEYVKCHVESRNIPASAAVATVNASVPEATLNTAGNAWSFGTATAPARLIYPIPLKLGDRITGYRVDIQKASATGTISAQLYKFNGVTHVETPLGAGSSNGSASPGAITLTESGLSIDSTLNQETFFLAVQGGGTTGDGAYGAEVTVVTQAGFTGAGFDDSASSAGPDGAVLVAINAGSLLRVPCPDGQIGRVIAVGLTSKGIGISADAYVGQKSFDASGNETIDNSIDANQLADVSGNGFKKRTLALDGALTQHHPTAGPTVHSSATWGISVPLWTSGMRVPYEEARVEGASLYKGAIVSLICPSGALVGPATWYIAEGL